MNRKTRIVSIVATLVALAAVAVLAGCGSSTSSSASPVASITPQASPTSGIAALKVYLGEVKAIAASVSTTANSLPGAVQGLSNKPDQTWTAAATQLTAAAQQFGDEATSLSQLTAPSGLQTIQDAGVKVIQAAQASVTKLAEGLNKGVSTVATTKAKILSAIADAQAKASGVGASIAAAVAGLLGQPAASPTP